MASGFDESTRVPPESSSSCSGNDAGDFECNICFELAQDPIVTLCGHLFCWPCLYRWLNHHSHAHECPVCKAIIEEAKLVPLYGRGKSQADPRAKSYAGMEIPRRPAGQRPETAPPPEANNFPNFGFGFNVGGFGQAPPAARSSNFNLSTAFGTGLSLFPSLFNIHFQGFPDATVYGTTSGYPYGFHALHGGHAHWFPQSASAFVSHQADTVLKNILFFIGFLVIVALLWCLQAYGSYNGTMKYSSIAPNDPDTHQDFQPSSKVDTSGMSLKDLVEQDAKENPVMLYMKGVPDFPQCGFTILAVQVLKKYNFDYPQGKFDFTSLARISSNLYQGRVRWRFRYNFDYAQEW